MGIFSKKVEEKEAVAYSTDGAADAPTKKKAAKKTAASTVTATAQVYGVVEAPIVTEKSHRLSSNRQYVFRVATDAKARAVKTAIAQAYGVTVVAVRMIVVKPKRRTMKYDRGYQKKYKKAVVTLAEGQTIDIFHAA